MTDMTPLSRFPSEVYKYVRKVFANANRRLCTKIALVPNCSEPSLDMTLVEHLSQYSAPKVVAPGWAIRIDVHYLGGLRHFYGWEIADIGVMVFAKRGSRLTGKKVALLQSKRLYPLRNGIIEEDADDYRTGMGRLLPGMTSLPSLAKPLVFDFTNGSRYKALKVNDGQFKAIEQYEAQQKIPVHYLLYNPWNVPTSYHFPVRAASPSLGRIGNGGARIVPASNLRSALGRKSRYYSPSFSDLTGLVSTYASHYHGWRLEHFIANLVLKCREGHLFEDIQEDSIFRLFNRRSGPIAAAISITIEQFDD